MKARAPIIIELHYSEKEIAEVERIQTEEVHTKRKDRIRELLHGPLCCICHSIPTKRIEYDVSGVIRIETYCDEHFPIYERNKDVDINEIMEAYGCTKAPEGSFGSGKKGYSLTPKSSLSDHTIICSRCRVTRIFFDETQRGYNKVLIPLEYKTLRPHDCDISYPFFCVRCEDTKLYFDRKVTNLRGGLIALEFETNLPHVCTWEDLGYREV